MKTITKIEKDDYLVIPNPNLVNEYKINTNNYTIGSGEKGLYFGELQVYNTLRVEGELNVLSGNIYNYILNRDINYDEIIYGVVTVDGTVNIGSQLSII